jgi:hypothetical protein
MRRFLRAPAMILAVVLTVAGAAVALAETTEEPEERFKDAEVTGTVVAYTSRSLSLEFDRSKTEVMEMLLPVDPAVTRFERVTGMKDLHRGDRIRVAYRQTYRQNEAGEWILKTAMATRISRLGESLGSPRLKSGSDGGGS